MLLLMKENSYDNIMELFYYYNILFKKKEDKIMMLNMWHFIGIIIIFVIICYTGYYSGKKIKCAEDFSRGGSSNSIIIAGAIMGTLVGGSSTVGTAQLAFTYGMSAWWFTLGGGISCLLLALFFVKPFRRNGSSGTLTGMIASEYGTTAGVLASLLSSVGIFINLLAQLIAAQALISVLFPNLNILVTTLIAAISMTIYVVFGGVFAAGLVGVIKLILLYAAVLIGAIVAISLSGGVGTFWNELPHATYFSLIARGAGTDIGAAVSLLFGVLSTQSYAQAVLSGRTDREAIKGSLISAVLIPPIGVGGILIGMYMKLNYPDIVPAQAFPLFIMEKMPSFVGGIILATLLIAIVGTGAGLSLGISTIINNDIIKKFTKKLDNAKAYLLSSRLMIVAILGFGTILTVIGLGETILNFAFMSMGLRASVVFIPLFCTLFFKKKISSTWIKISIIGSPLTVFIGNLADLPFDSLFLGMLFSLICAIIGGIVKKYRN